MATLGNSNQIIVGAAQLYVAASSLKYIAGSSPALYAFEGIDPDDIPNMVASTPYPTTLDSASATFRNVGFTSNGLEIQFQPDFGEVQVDQLLDVARLFKQGMKVNLVTAFAEGTLENLAVAIATDAPSSGVLNIQSGNIGDVPVDRAMIAVGPGSGDPEATGASAVERVYVAHRALSIESVSAMAKRDAPTMFEVTFRLLPASNGSYGKIVDRTVSDAATF